MSETPLPCSFIAIGLAAGTKDRVAKLVDVSKVKFVETQIEFEELLESVELEGESSIFVGAEVPGVDVMEIGQALRAYYMNANIVFVTTDPKLMGLETLKKNGYSKVFLLPLDAPFFEEEVLSAFQGSVRKRYKAVKLVDISPDEELNFNVYTYMPLNQKYVLLTAEGKLSEKKYEKLKERTQPTVFVESDKVEAFYDYSAQKLAKLHDGESVMSETERGEKLKQSVQTLFHNLLDQDFKVNFNAGKDLTDQSNQIIQKFVESKTKVNLKEKILDILGTDGGSYAHAQSVSSLAFLLSMGLGIGKPEDLALAGLFHDIGVTGFEVEPNPLTMHSLNPEDAEHYRKHPMLAVHILKNKKLILTPSVSEIIEKHHERVDGAGFPNALPAHKVPLEAQLLSFCDYFEYFMQAARDGDSKIGPMDVFDKIQKTAGLSVDLMLKIKSFFSDLEE